MVRFIAKSDGSSKVDMWTKMFLCWSLVRSQGRYPENIHWGDAYFTSSKEIPSQLHQSVDVSRQN